MKKVKKKAILFKKTAFLLLFLIVAPSFTEKKRSNGTKKLYANEEILMLTYNIGDCTFGENVSCISPKQTKENLKGVISLIEEGDYDVCLLQESNWLNIGNYLINPSKKIANYFSDCSYIYGSNSNVLNYLDNGNMTLTKYMSENKCLRIPIHGRGKYNDYFLVHKLLIETRIKIENSNNELVIYNIHLAPYLKNKTVKREQINYLLELANIEYQSGNYVVIGGDWNTNLNKESLNQQLEEVFKNNLWEFEKIEGPTHQSENENGQTVNQTIDGFLFSPNLVGNVKNLEDFSYSDHSPVELKLNMK